jgi:hypothetical protein
MGAIMLMCTLKKMEQLEQGVSQDTSQPRGQNFKKKKIVFPSSRVVLFVLVDAPAVLVSIIRQNPAWRARRL